MERTTDRAEYASNTLALLLTVAVMTLFAVTRTAVLALTAARPVTNADLNLRIETAPPPAPSPPMQLPAPRLAPIAPRIPLPQPLLPTEPDRDVPEDAAVVATAAPPPPPSPSDGAARMELESAYAAALRADIDRRTVLPDSPEYRLRHPTGEVRVRFTVLREGASKVVTLVRSSGSALLDQAALGIVAAGHYLPMPAKAFPGESEHVFVVTIEFRGRR